MAKHEMVEKMVHEILHGETCKHPAAVAELCIDYAKSYADDEPLASALLTRAAEVIIAYEKDPIPTTPPQPEAGGGVTDAMVEAAADAFAGEGVHDCSSDMLRRVIRAALTAALSTTPASGGEHG